MEVVTNSLSDFFTCFPSVGNVHAGSGLKDRQGKCDSCVECGLNEMCINSSGAQRPGVQH